MKTRFLAKSTIFNYFTKGFYILPANTRSSMDRYAGINTEWDYGFRKGRNCINVAGNVVNNVTIAYDEWHEVCYIYDVSTGAAQYYIDGTLIPIVHNTEPILECGLKIFYPGDTKTAKEKNLLPEDILYIDDTEIYSYTPAVMSSFLTLIGFRCKDCFQRSSRELYSYNRNDNDGSRHFKCFGY